MLLFNGRDGEFAATIGAATRKRATLTIGERSAAGIPARRRLSVRAAEARAARLHGAEGGRDGRAPPAAGHHPPHAGARVNLDRLAANAREAAEQCGVIWLPEMSPERPLDAVLAAWPAERLLIFCDEDAPLANPLDALPTAPERRRQRC